MWSDWRNWPHLMFALDLGSDGNTATSAWLYLLDLCVTKVPDLDHGLMRGLLESLKACHLYEFVILMLVSLNFFNGPKDNDYRYHQLRQCGQAIQKRFTAKTCQHFQEHCPAIKADLQRHGVEVSRNQRHR